MNFCLDFRVDGFMIWLDVIGLCVCVCVCLCMRMCVCAGVCACCVYVCMRVRVRARAWVRIEGDLIVIASRSFPPLILASSHLSQLRSPHLTSHLSPSPRFTSPPLASPPLRHLPLLKPWWENVFVRLPAATDSGQSDQRSTGQAQHGTHSVQERSTHPPQHMLLWYAYPPSPTPPPPSPSLPLPPSPSPSHPLCI